MQDRKKLWHQTESEMIYDTINIKRILLYGNELHTFIIGRKITTFNR